jgi:hypothetical protein
MSSFHVDEAVRPLVAWALRYARSRHLAMPFAGDLDGLTRVQATRLLHAIDAVGNAASSRVLAFTDFAVLDELGAVLADWLREAPGDQPLAA